MRNELETTTIERDVELCEDSGDLKEILRKYDGYYLNWQSDINRFLDESGLSYSRLAQKCGISKNTLKKWCCEGGAPRSRNTFLRIGFGLGMNAAEVSRLLTRYGGYHGLYAKELFDAVCIYALERRCVGDERYTYEYAEKLYERCAAASGRAVPNAVQSGAVCGADKFPRRGGEEPYLQTEALLKQLQDMETEEDFLSFSQQYGELLTGRGEKLAAYLGDYLRAKAPEQTRSVRRARPDRKGGLGGNERLDGSAEDGALNVSEALSILGIPKRFEKIWSQLSVHGIIPRREQLIALALHLEMMPEEVDELLRLAGMERLCAKDRLECVIIYALQQLCLYHPEITLSNAIELLAVTKDEKQRKRCRHIVEEYTVNCYRCSEEDADTVAGYVKELLISLDLDEAKELLQMI